MNGENKYYKAYKLETEKGVKAFLNNYNKLSEARYYANDLSISDLLMDFDLAYKRCLTERQQEVIRLTYFKDYKQSDVARLLNLTQQTIQEHIKKSVKNIATYHLLQTRREEC